MSNKEQIADAGEPPAAINDAVNLEPLASRQDGENRSDGSNHEAIERGRRNIGESILNSAT